MKEALPENAEIIFCCGFFILYIIDEIVHICCGEAIQHSHGRHTNHHHYENPLNDGSDQETQSLLGSSKNLSSCEGEASTSSSHVNVKFNGVSNQHNHHTDNYKPSYGSDQETKTLIDSCNEGIMASTNTITNSTGSCEQEAANARICHVNHTEPCIDSFSGIGGLLIALSLHSFLEGLAIGVQESGNKVLLLLGAVASHKYVVGFCLGMELSTTHRSQFKNHLFGILTFSLGSVVGIAIGMVIVDAETSWTESAVPILQGLAGGTLLYVTVCEVLPREKAKWHKNRANRYAGIYQLIAVCLGFIVMTMMNRYISK